MDIKTNYFNMTQIEADSANGIDLCLRNFAIAARSADCANPQIAPDTDTKIKVDTDASLQLMWKIINY